MDCLDILKQLVSFDTVNPPGREEAAVIYLKSLLEPYGFECRVQTVDKNRANLIAVIGDRSGPELMLNGHLDVVPAAGNWKHPPFSVTEEGGRLYGRGVADMKGGIAAMCEAAIRVAVTGGPKNGCVKLLFVADEECSNLGIHRYFEEYQAGEWAVIGEPTGLAVSVAHRGVSRDFIDVHGVSRHAALPASGGDAVNAAAKVILAIEDLNRELQTVRHEVLPPPSVAVTMVQGYEKDNVVPGFVRLLLDFRILPGMGRERVRQILEEGLKKRGISNFQIRSHFYMPGGALSADDDFAAACAEESNRIQKRRVVPCAFDASCEQCFLVERGVKTVICGPGDLAQAHTVDEYTEKKQVRMAADLYEAIIRRTLRC